MQVSPLLHTGFFGVIYTKSLHVVYSIKALKSNNLLYNPYMYMYPLQEICFTESCNFDGGDCFGRVQHPTPSPWANCSAKAVCRLLFSDGHCDVQCNTPGCLFDGFDCSPPSQCAQESTCLSRLDDGMCSPECNTLECPYDFKDCGDQDLVSILKNCTLHSSGSTMLTTIVIMFLLCTVRGGRTRITCASVINNPRLTASN